MWKIEPPKQDPLQIGLTIVAATALFGIVGWWIDRRLETFPLLMALGCVIGFSAAMYHVIMRVRQMDDKKGKEEEAE